MISAEIDDAEFEKRFGAALMAGDPVISFDNCIKPLDHALLCQALTQTRLNLRMLGFSTESRHHHVGAADGDRKQSDPAGRHAASFGALRDRRQGRAAGAAGISRRRTFRPSFGTAAASSWWRC